MKYVSYLNREIGGLISALDNYVVYGQNVDTGSCLGGLTRDFNKIDGCKVLNTPNTENALVGMGFGLMIDGTSSAYFMKQQDFLLLGIDHLRNTNNFIRQIEPKASFSIVNIVMDAGYEGIQSSLNNLSDFCAISDCEGYTVSSIQDADFVLSEKFMKPGLKIISVSSRLFTSEIMNIKTSCNSSNSIIRYREGGDLTVTCLNFSLPQGVGLCKKLSSIGWEASLYNILAAHPISYESIIRDAKKTGRLLILDDSKSYATVSNILEVEALRAGVKLVKNIRRNITQESYRPHSEIFDIDLSWVVSSL